MKYQESAGIIIYRMRNEQREYLLLHYISGHWDLPKGKLEQGETKEQAALRELNEETGLTAKIEPGFCETLAYNFIDYDGAAAHKKVSFFVGKLEGAAEKIVLSHEHQDFGWLTYEQAIKRLTYDNARAILHKAEGFIALTN